MPDFAVPTLPMHDSAETRAFYEKLGWRVVSDEFVIEHYGPHRRMMTRV